MADSAFTERILGLPNENYKGYVEADVRQRARHIPSHSYFLIHGLADSSAPYLHGTQLARELAKAGVIFQYQVRDNVAHHILNLMRLENSVNLIPKKKKSRNRIVGVSVSDFHVNRSNGKCMQKFVTFSNRFRFFFFVFFSLFFFVHTFSFPCSHSDVC